MKKDAVLVQGTKRTPVIVDEDKDGSLVIYLQSKRWFSLEEPEEELPLPRLEQEWVFSDDDLPDNIEPQDNPEITINDLLPSTPENSMYNWRLLVHRFPWLFAKDYEYKQAVKYAEEVSAGKVATGNPRAAVHSQLRLDLEMIRPRLTEIIQSGQFVYGHQSVIARLLGGENHGGFRRNRILPVEAALSRLTSSATSANSTATNGKNQYFDLAQRSRQK